MENFFYDDVFCQDMSDLLDWLDIDEDNINSLQDEWSCIVQLSDLEPIFDIDATSLCEMLADANEDRLSEDLDEEKEVLKALKKTIDFIKLREELPKYYYPNNKFRTITKSDLIKWLS